MARKISSREFGLLGVLAAAIALVLWFNQDTGLGGGSAGDEAEDALRLDEAPLVRMDLLAQGIQDYDPKGRNLFQYFTPPPPRQPVTKPKVVERPKPQPRPTPPPSRVVNRPAPRAKPPAIPYKYLGFMGPKERKIAVFEAGPELLLARAGEVIGDKFRVVEFGHESIIIGYTQDPWTKETTELSQSR